MARRKKIKVSQGDIFIIPINEELFSVGQVVFKGATSDVFIIFDCKYKQGVLLSEVVNHPILFMLNTVDTKIEDDEWKIIGNGKIPRGITLPNFISKTLDGYEVLDAGGQCIREATENDVEKLSYLMSISPVIVEDAVKAKFGDGEWYPYLENLLYKP